MAKTSFLGWMKEKFSIGSKKRYAGATVQEGYFRYETFNFNQLMAKSDELETNETPFTAGENLDGSCLTSPEQNKEEANDEGEQSAQPKKSSKRNSGTFKFRSSKKKELKRATVIPSIESSSEKFNTSPRENNFKKSQRLRFSFVGTLRKKLRRESYSNNDLQASKGQEHFHSTNYDETTPKQRSKRILSAPSLKTSSGSKSYSEEKQRSSSPLNRYSDEAEYSFKCSGNNLNETNSSIRESIKTSKSDTPADKCCTPNSLARKIPRRCDTVSLTKVSSFFSSPPFSENESSRLAAPDNSNPLSDVNEYVRFNASKDQKLPQSPNHRNSDPYVNLHFHRFNLYGGSQESIKEDNYCLRPDDCTPVIPPRTYKKDVVRSHFHRSARPFQSFSSFGSLASSNNNINSTFQQLPRSVAAKCEAFCKRVDAISSDYLPMNMHPLSNKLSNK